MAGLDNHFPRLDTARLMLRCVGLEDAEPIAQAMTADVSRWLASWPTPCSVDAVVDRISSFREALVAGNALPFSVVERAGGQFVGMVTFNRAPDYPRRATISYWLGTNHQGKGYMREAVPPALSVAFDFLDVDIVAAGAQPSNTASFAVMLANGMKRASDRLVYAPARERLELCHFYEIERRRDEA